ncbi:MAG TPA: hypothetical protein VEP89_05930, partial [Draconibacterium sp.]|nr:hypothetical protein [Draconibacterium sp.]
MNKLILLFFFFSLMSGAFAQFQAIEEESEVPEYKLPDPLIAFNGKKIRNSKKWENKRRPELLKFFTENMYGEIPGKLEITSAELLEKSNRALNGKAERKQVELSFKHNGKTLRFTILIYLPVNEGKTPIFLGYNFLGNHTIAEDVNVIISEAWAPDNPSLGIINNQLTEQSRGARTDQ